MTLVILHGVPLKPLHNLYDVYLHASIFTFADVLGVEQNDAVDVSPGIFDESDDEGWESDSSGHTNIGELSSQDEAPHQNPAKTKLHKNGQNCEETEKGKPMQFKQPLSSTLACDSTGISEIKMDPKLSPVELQSNNDFKDFKGHENRHSALPNHMVDQGPGYSFMPGILAENVLTSTKIEYSPDSPMIRHEVPPPQKDALSPLAISSYEREERAITDTIDGNPNPEGISSFAQAVLNSRNKIANVLFKAVMDFQKGNSSRDSGYESLSTDTASSSSTVQSTSKESLFLPDKLLKEFSNRLTAETMSNGNNTSGLPEPNHSSWAPNSLTRRNQSGQKTKMLIGPNVMANNKNRTVSLLTSRKTIKFNPSLPGLRKGMSSTPLSNEKKSIYIPLSMGSKTVDQHGRLKTSVSTKAVLKIFPIQSTSPTALVPKNTFSITRGLSEPPTARNSPLKLIQNQQTPLVLKLPQDQKRRPLMRQENKLQLVEKSDNFSKPVIKLQESSGRPCVAISRRRSVSLTNCLPVTDSEILRHSTNLSDFQRYMQHHGRGPQALPRRSLPARDRLGSPQNTPTLRDRGNNYEQGQRRVLKVHPELHLLPGQDVTKVYRRLPGQNGGQNGGQSPLGSSRKRSFDSSFFNFNEKTSPKRTCRRSNDNEEKSSHEKDLFTLKLGAGKEKIMGGLTNNERIKKHHENLLKVNGYHPEVFDMEVEGSNRGYGKSSWKEDEARESRAVRDFAESKPRRHSQKLFTEGTRSPYPLVKLNPSDNMRIPWKTSNEDSTKKTSCRSSNKDTNTADDRYHTSRGRLVRTDNEGISPSYRDHRTQLSRRGNTLEEFKKTSPGIKRAGDKDSTIRAAHLSEKIRRFSCTRTSQDDSNCYKDYRRSSYDSATEESCSGRCHTARIRKSSSETHFFPGRNPRPILEVGDQNYKTSNRNKYSTHQNDSPCSHSHEKLTSRKKLGQATVEKTSTGKLHLSRRKRDRESKDKAQEVCLNKTFKIDKVPRVLESYDCCTSGTCTKLFCLNCGNFPSTIQDSSVSSADSFYGD